MTTMSRLKGGPLNYSKSTEIPISLPDETVLNTLTKEIKQRESKSKKRRSKEDWRSTFALIILLGYFASIISIIITCLINSSNYNMIELLNTVGSLIGAPLGFVIGYYYKSKS